MTTKANKFGLRAAAAERSNRHAQRTPLPPRPGDVQAARETIAEAASVAPKAATSGIRSLNKAAAFQAKAEAAGWDVVMDVQPVADGVELTATRGPETIIQAWSDGVWSYPTSFYAHGDRTTKPRNASGAAKLLERSEADAAAEAGKVASNKHFRKAEPKDIEEKLETAQRRLPFDPELATDEIILAAVNGQALVWYNRLRRGQEAALVSRKGARITRNPAGERVVLFCCPVTGYRACLVTSILRVGKGKSSVTAGSATNSAAVEVA